MCSVVTVLGYQGKPVPRSGLALELELPEFLLVFTVLMLGHLTGLFWRGRQI